MWEWTDTPTYILPKGINRHSDIYSPQRDEQILRQIFSPKGLTDTPTDILPKGMNRHYNRYSHTPTYILPRGSLRCVEILNDVPVWQECSPCNQCQQYQASLAMTE